MKSSGVRLLFIILILFKLVIQSRAEDKCSNPVETSNFDPEIVLKNKGIDLSKLYFFTGDQNPFQEITWYYRGRHKGGLAFEIKRKYSEIRIIEISRGKLRKIGLGTTIYLGFAKLLFDEKRKILKKSIDTSSSADAVWDRLTEQGFAEKFGPDDEYRIRLEALKGNQFTPAKRFIESRLIRISDELITGTDTYGEPIPILEKGVKVHKIISGRIRDKDHFQD